MRSVIFFFGIGMLLGGGLVGFFCSRQIEKNMIGDAIAAAGHCYSAARAIRTGETNDALETLESHLDGQILVLGTFLEDKKLQANSPGMRTLGRLRDYRRRYPRVTENAEIDAVVSNTLLIVPMSGVGTDK